MSWIKVQRGVVDFGPSEDTKEVTITAVGALSKAFARIAGITFSSGGLAAGSTADKNNDDLGVTCVLTATDTITLTRLSSGENDDYRYHWEVWEYVGSPGGANEFIVRYHDVITDSGGETDQLISGVASLDDVAVFITGQGSDGTVQVWDRAAFTAETVDSGGSDYVRVKRNDAAGTGKVSVAAVEFTGSAWSVQQVQHADHTTDGDETETISDVSDWDNVFIIHGHRTIGAGRIRLSSSVRPGTTTTSLRFNNGGNVAIDTDMVAFVVRNPHLEVEHLDSITGGKSVLPAGSASPQTETETVTEVANLDESAVIAGGTSAGTGAQYPMPMWLYHLLNATTLEFWRGRHGVTTRWAAQIVQFLDTVQEIALGLTEETEAPLTLALSVQTPQLTVARGALRTFKLDADGDLAMVGGRTVIIEGAEAAVQVIAGLLEVHVGEWLMDAAYGVPHITEYHAVYPNVAGIYASLRSKISALWFVDRVEDLKFDVAEDDPEDLKVVFRVRLIDGTAATGEARI